MNSQRKWWAFEGFTSVDCILETENYLLLIEGKRTERISNSTDWFPKRNQVVRNVEVARYLANGKNFGVMVCAETLVELAEEVWAESLPHLLDSDRAELKLHYLGCVTWSAIVNRLCDGIALPRDVNTAVEMILGVRQRKRTIS
jgi:hypothetical protein